MDDSFLQHPNDIEILPMLLPHSSQVLQIYGEGLATGEATFETRIPSWEVWDNNHSKVCRLVAMRNKQVKGWAALSPVSTRQVYSGVAEVSIYIAESARGSGIGKTLLKDLIALSEAHGIWTLQAGIFPENTASMQLHLNAGFRIIGTREKIGQLSNTWRDTCLLERRSTKVGVIDFL